MTAAIANNIEHAYVPDLDTGCWLWTKSVTSFGYGQLRTNGRTVRAHRFVYELYYGHIPVGLVVRHKCDQPKCINPDHLELGTQADNVEDMHRRGRALKAKGTANGRSKLDDDAVRFIRRVHVNGCRQFGVRPLARKCGVDPKTIRQIISRQTWRNV